MLDRRSFDYMMTGSSEESADESIKNNNITKAYNYFLKKIDVSKVDFKTIIDHLQFVVIDLVNDEDEQQIFDTINSLGVKLTTAELLKNYLFDEDSKNKYEEKWYPTFEKEQEIIDFWDEDITTGRLKKTNLDNLLYCYLQIKIKEKGVSSETRANHFRRWDGLFENFKNLVNEYDVSKEELISDITTYAELYRANLISSNASKISLIPESGIERVNFLIWQLDCTTVIPYVLFVLKEINEDKEEQTKIFEYLETYLMRRVFANSSNNSYSDLFSFHLLGNDGKSAESLKAYIISKEGFDIGMPTNEQVIKGTEDHTWRNSKALVVLYMIESKRYDRERSSTDLKSYSEFSLEHLMPRKSDKWLMSEDVTDEMRKKAIYSLGNMAMITQSLNASISNSEWSIKKAGNGKNFGLEKYTTGLETMKGVLDKEVWDEATISDRSKQLGKEATEIWCI